MDDSDPFERYEEFFASMAASIVEFASRRGLRLEKYPQEAPVWSLIFRHPGSGIAKIDLNRRNDGHVGVSGVWWKDDFDAGSRSLVHFAEEVAARNSDEAARAADRMLERILAHPLGSWTKVVDGYEALWHPYGRSFIENEEKRYRFPKEK